MATTGAQVRSAAAWDLTRRQHGVVTHAQLRELGLSSEAIRHRLRRGRLHRVMRGVYAVGRPQLEARGRWMAAVLACGPRALLSHRSAAALWGIRPEAPDRVEVVVPADLPRRRPGIRVYRHRDHEAPGRRSVADIPVTHPIATLVDLAAGIPTGQLEAAINEADHLDLVDPEQLLLGLGSLPLRRGVKRIRALLEASTTTLTSTELERRFLPLVRSAGLPVPQTQVWLDGHRVDFFWPDLGLVAETDSLRYHRTPFKQANDKRRDNAHAGSGLTTLRFTDGQIRHEPDYVRRTLIRTARALANRRTGRTRRRDD
jgi:predicted transcriptional regulator of viral defense system